MKIKIAKFNTRLGGQSYLYILKNIKSLAKLSENKV